MRRRGGKTHLAKPSSGRGGEGCRPPPSEGSLAPLPVGPGPAPAPASFPDHSSPNHAAGAERCPSTRGCPSSPTGSLRPPTDPPEGFGPFLCGASCTATACPPGTGSRWDVTAGTAPAVPSAARPPAQPRAVGRRRRSWPRQVFPLLQTRRRGAGALRAPCPRLPVADPGGPVAGGSMSPALRREGIGVAPRGLATAFVSRLCLRPREGTCPVLGIAQALGKPKL